MQLTVGLLLGGQAFAGAGETPVPPLVSLGLLRPWFGGICARLIHATPAHILHTDKQLLPHFSWLPTSSQDP